MRRSRHEDSNKQRADLLPSEMAALLELEVEDIKHQGTRLKGVAEGDIGKRSVEIVGEAHDLNYKKVMRYLRLNSLVPELLEKVDAFWMKTGNEKGHRVHARCGAFVYPTQEPAPYRCVHGR